MCKALEELEQDIDIIQPLYNFAKDHMDMPEDELIAFYLENCQTRQK